MYHITLHIIMTSDSGYYFTPSESSESSPSSNEVSHLTSESAAEASPFNIILNLHDFIFLQRQTHSALERL